MPAEDWGVQSTGFVRPTMEEIREDRVLAWRALFGENQPVDPGSINGRYIDFVTEAMNIQFALAEGTYNSRYLSTAGLNAIDLLIEEYGYVRAAATYSTVTLTLTGTPGTLVPALSRVQTDSLDTWITSSGGLIGGGGRVDVSFGARRLVRSPLSRVARGRSSLRSPDGPTPTTRSTPRSARTSRRLPR